MPNICYTFFDWCIKSIWNKITDMYFILLSNAQDMLKLRKGAINNDK